MIITILNVIATHWYGANIDFWGWTFGAVFDALVVGGFGRILGVFTKTKKE